MLVVPLSPIEILLIGQSLYERMKLAKDPWFGHQGYAEYNTLRTFIFLYMETYQGLCLPQAACTEEVCLDFPPMVAEELFTEGGLVVGLSRHGYLHHDGGWTSTIGTRCWSCRCLVRNR